MKNPKFWKMALPALLLSALMFETMPGSVGVFGQVATPETVYNFFNLQAEHPAAACLPLAGLVTAVTAILALVGLFSKKVSAHKAVCWGSLVAAALTAVPYMVPSEGVLLQPNVIITILLSLCWLAAFLQDKKEEKTETAEPGRRL